MGLTMDRAMTAAHLVRDCHRLAKDISFIAEVASKYQNALYLYLVVIPVWTLVHEIVPEPYNVQIRRVLREAPPYEYPLDTGKSSFGLLAT